MTTSFSIELLQGQNRKLRDQIDELNETVRQLRAQLAPDRSVLPNWLPHLTRTERKCLVALGTGRIMSKEAVHAYVYDNDPSGGPEIKIVDVFICKLRRKLVDLIHIETFWGQGYQLSPESIELLWPTQREIAA